MKTDAKIELLKLKSINNFNVYIKNLAMKGQIDDEVYRDICNAGFILANQHYNLGFTLNNSIFSNSQSSV